MKVYRRGDDAGEPNIRNAVWVAYYYEVGDYCGSGNCLVKYDNGKFYYGDLGHCSCYGPWEDVETKAGIETWEEVIKHMDAGKVSTEDLLLREAIEEALKDEKQERVCVTCAHDPASDKDVKKWCGKCELYAYREKVYHWKQKEVGDVHI